LSVTARRWGTFWLRSGVALGVILAAMWIFSDLGGESQREIGQIIFYVLTGASLAYCLLAGLRATADWFESNRKKREGRSACCFSPTCEGTMSSGKALANSLTRLRCTGRGARAGCALSSWRRHGRRNSDAWATVLVNTLFFSLCVGVRLFR